MNTRFKRLLSLCMALVLVLTFMPFEALGAILTEPSGGVSIRSIVQPGVKVDTYVFKADGATVQTQLVKEGETLLEPNQPVKAGHKFQGWLKGSTPFTGFGPVTGVTGATIEITAKFSPIFYINFLDDQGRVGYAHETTAGATVNNIDALGAQVVVDATKGITGWYNSPALTTRVTTVTMGSANVTLWPKTATGAWLTYNSHGGTVIAPVFMLPTQTTVEPTRPTRTGYTFRYWSTTENGPAFSFGGTISNATTLHAVWQPNTVNFTIIHWTENADDDGYTYNTTGTGSGLAGSTITLTPAQTNSSLLVGDAAAFKPFFTYKEYDQNVVINGDGSSIVNVRHSRNRYSVTFDLGNDSSKKMTVGGNSYTGGSGVPKYSFTAKFDSKIDTLWPVATNFEEDDKFYGWAGIGSSIFVSKRINLTYNLCITGGANMSARYNVSYYDHLNYMIESLDQTSGGNGDNRRQYNGRWYDRDATYSQTAGSQGGSWSAKEIIGTTSVGVETENVTPVPPGYSGSRKVFFYYNRNTYKLDFYNFNATDSAHTETLKYGVDISDRNYTPSQPSAMNPIFQFMGWYTSAALVQAVNWTNLKMPGHNMTSFAKWAAPDQTVKVHVQMDPSSNAVTINVPYGTPIPQNQLPNINVPANHKMIGWATRRQNGSYAVFNLSTPIVAPTTIFPFIVFTGNLKVIYNANGGTGAVPVDNNNYSSNTEAEVMGQGGITRAGKTFVGWSRQQNGGAIVLPGSTVLFSDSNNITLYAQWSDVVGTYKIKYYQNHSNADNTNQEKGPFNNNSQTTLEGASLFAAPVGHKFKAWGTTRGGGVTFAAGAAVRFDNVGENNLYAIWDKRTDLTVKVHHYWNGTTTSVAPTQTVPNQTFGSQYTANPATVAGHTPVSAAAKTITVSADEAQNVIIFYYYKDVALTAKGGNIKYDGQTKSVSGFEGAPAGVTFNITVGATGKDVGSYPANFPANAVGTKDTTDKYIVKTATNGIMRIIPRTIIMTSPTREKFYDGQPLTATTIEEAGEGWAPGEGVNYNVTGTITNVGSVPNSFTFTPKEGTKLSNYAYDHFVGTLTVKPLGAPGSTPVTVIIKGNKDEFPFDGNPHTVTGYTATPSVTFYDAAANVNFTGTDSVTRTATGVSPMGLQVNQFSHKASNPNFVNVRFVVEDGEIKITAAGTVTVTITGNSKTVSYNGTEQYVENYNVSSSNPLYGPSKFTYTGTGANKTASGTNAGEYNMTMTPAMFRNDDPTNFPNVTFVVNNGKLTIRPFGQAEGEKLTVTVNGNNKNVIYNGSEQSVTGFTATPSAVPAIPNLASLYKTTEPGRSFSFSGTAEAKGTNAGTYNMTMTPGQFANTNTNFTNVEFVVNNGALKIYPVGDPSYPGGSNPAADVKITGNERTVMYDGNEHSVTGYTYNAGAHTSLIDKAHIKYDGVNGKELTVSGTDAGTYPMGMEQSKFALDNGNFVNTTFTLVKDGKLTINKRTGLDGLPIKVKITGNAQNFIYDGSEKVVEGYKFESPDPLYKREDLRINTPARAARTIAGVTFMDLTSAGRFTNLNQNFVEPILDITDGFVRIYKIGDPDYPEGPNPPAKLKIEGNNKTVSFTGTPHELKGYQVLENSHPALISSLNAIKYDGVPGGLPTRTETASGTYPLGMTPARFSLVDENFQNPVFEVTDGKLVIEAIDAVTVTIKGERKEVIFDGQAHTVNTYTAEASNPLYNTATMMSFTGNVSNHTATRTDAGITEMTLTPQMFVNNNPNFTTFNVVIEQGWIKVLPFGSGAEKLTVNIRGNTKTRNYNKTTHNVSGYGASATAANPNLALHYNPNMGSPDYTFSGTASVSGMDVGTYNMGLAASQFTNTNPNFTDVRFVVTDGWLKINPYGTPSENPGEYPNDPVIQVNVAGNNDTVTYDGQEHTLSGYTFNGAVPAWYVQTDFTGANKTVTKTDANEAGYPLGYTAADFSNVNPNVLSTHVNFNVTDGKLIIKRRGDVNGDPIRVKVNGNKGNFIYDGSPKTVSGFVMTSPDPLYLQSYLKAVPDATVTQTDAGVAFMNLVPGRFQNQNGNFLDPVVEVESDGFVRVYAVGDPTWPGDPDNGIPGGPAGNPPANVKITGNTDSVEYDGNPHGVHDYQFVSSHALLRKEHMALDGTVGAIPSVTGMAVGNYPMGLNTSRFTVANPNFVNTQLEVIDGGLTINPPANAVVYTVVGNSDTVTYDGAVHTVEGYTITKTQDPVGNHQLSSVVYSGGDNKKASGTNAGSYTMTLSAADFSNSDPNYANVYFMVTPGTLVIEPRGTKPEDIVQVNITGNKAAYVYDGTQKSVSGVTYGYTNNYNNLYNDSFIDSSAANLTVTGTNAGAYPMDLARQIAEGKFVNTNPNFVNVRFVLADDGLLYIQQRGLPDGSTETPLPGNTPVEVSIAGNTRTVTFNGLPQQVEGYNMYIAESALYAASNVAFNGTAVATGTDAGTYYMDLPGKFMNTNPNFGKVVFNVADGWIKIDPLGAIAGQEVKVHVVGNKVVDYYDGTAKTAYDYTTQITNDQGLYNVNYLTFTGNKTATQTHAGAAYMGMTPAHFVNWNPNFANVQVTVDDGYAAVAKRPITLTSADDQKTYDGTPLTNSGITVGGMGYVPGESFSYNVTGTLTAVGTTPNVFTYTANPGTDVNDYDVTQVNGTLTVEHYKGTLTFIIGGETVYTGQPQTPNVVVPQLPPGYTLVFIDVPVTGTDAGEYPSVRPNFKIINNNGDDVTNDLITEFVLNPMVIKPATLTITSESATKKYDKVPLSAPGTMTGLVNGETATISFPVTLTDAGNVTNSYVLLWNGTAKAKNYSIVENLGTLEVTKRQITFISGSATKPFDFQPLYNTTVTEVGDGFIAPDGATRQVTGYIEKRGWVHNTFEITYTPSTNLNNYEIVKINGVLEITRGGDFLLSIDYRADDTREFLAPSHREIFTVGADYAIKSPAISGFTPRYPTVYGTMGFANKHYTVFYIRNTPVSGGTNTTPTFPGTTVRPTATPAVTNTPRPQATPVPGTNTIPSATATPRPGTVAAPAATATPRPGTNVGTTATATPVPGTNVVPGATATPRPGQSAAPAATASPAPATTAGPRVTPTPAPRATATPAPGQSSAPVATATPRPGSTTSVNATATPRPGTNAVPVATATPRPGTNTVPRATPTPAPAATAAPRVTPVPTAPAATVAPGGKTPPAATATPRPGTNFPLRTTATPAPGSNVIPAATATPAPATATPAPRVTPAVRPAATPAPGQAAPPAATATPRPGSNTPVNATATPAPGTNVAPAATVTPAPGEDILEPGVTLEPGTEETVLPVDEQSGDVLPLEETPIFSLGTVTINLGESHE